MSEFMDWLRADLPYASLFAVMAMLLWQCVARCKSWRGDKEE